MKRVLVVAAGALFASAAVVLGIGLAAPASHRAKCRIEFPGHTPRQVWELVGDVEGWSEWNSLVDGMEPRPDDGPGERWLMASEWGKTPARIEAREPDSRLVVHLDGDGFEGRWTYELAPAESATGTDTDIDTNGRGCVLEITEAGRVANPVMRAIGLFMDEHESMRTVMTDLAVRLGETDSSPVIVPVE